MSVNKFKSSWMKLGIESLTMMNFLPQSQIEALILANACFDLDDYSLQIDEE